MVRRASHAKTHCHSLQNAILHQSKKEQNALAHWTCCMFFVYLFLAKLVQPYKYNMHWHSLVFYQPQLYILPCLTKATKAKCTGTKTKSMQCFVYMFFFVKLMLVLIEQNALAQSCFTACLSFTNAFLHQSKKEQNALAHWAGCIFCSFFGKALSSHKQNTLAQPCFLQASALYPALPHQSNKSKMHRHKDKIHAMFCVHVLFCKAHASTDWAKRIGTFCFALLSALRIASVPLGSALLQGPAGF